MIYESDFAVGQRIRVVAPDAEGYVHSIRFDLRGAQLLVSYWMDGKRCEEWLYPVELAPF